VLFADFNAVGVSSVAVPTSMLTSQHILLEGAGVQNDETEAAAAAGEEDAETMGLDEEPDETQAGDTDPPAAAAADEAPTVQAAESSNAAEVLRAAVEQHAAEAEQLQCSSPGLQEFSQLCALDLSDNRLSCIAGLAWLPALQQLILSANRLRSLQGLAHVLGSISSSSSMDAAAEDVANVAADAAHGVQPQDTEGQRQEEPDVDAAAAVEPEPCSVVAQRYCPAGGFSCLRLLDVSFNLIPAEQLLGINSPLAQLPR
jgi:Leucine-rich repeat (LRR) protein